MQNPFGTLKENDHFQVMGMNFGKAICRIKASGELVSIHPMSPGQVVCVAPMQWWMAKGYRLNLRSGGARVAWHGAHQAIFGYAESLGQIDRATYNELMRQRAMRRLGYLKAIYEQEEMASASAA